MNDPGFGRTSEKDFTSVEYFIIDRFHPSKELMAILEGKLEHHVHKGDMDAAYSIRQEIKNARNLTKYSYN